MALHPEKTRLLNFNRPKGGARPETFSFLGFTFYWGKSQKGLWALKAKTEKSRLKRAKGHAKEWIRKNRHLKVKQQWKILCRKIKGHYGYYGISHNMRSLRCFVRSLEYSWLKWLNRRSQRAGMHVERFKRLLKNYPLPQPTINHRWF